MALALPANSSTDGTFGLLLRAHRHTARLSVNRLAREIAVDPSYISRLERAEREPPRRPICLRLIGALALSTEDGDRLLSAAGHATAALQALGGWDATVQAVADVLSNPLIAESDRLAFRSVVEIMAARWQPRPRRMPHVASD